MAERTPEEAVALDVADGLATLTISYPPVNPLAQPVTLGLEQRLAAAFADPAVKAVVITGAGGNFVAGADITRLEKWAAGDVPAETSSQAPSGLLEIFASIEDGPKPVVAAIDGFALGGGLELALSCHARVGTKRCRVGLPELQLGLLPGAGGTQRLARLAGVAKACEMMLTSKPEKAPSAHALGILDEVVDAPEALLPKAKEVALGIAAGDRPLRKTLRLDDRIETGDDAKAIVEAARADSKKKARNVDFNDLTLDAILEGALHGPEAGLRKEAEGFGKLIRSPQAAALIHVFFAQRAAAKVPGVTDQGLEPRPIRKVGILGGGTMGSGISTALVKSGIHVVMKELNAELLEAGLGRVRKNVERDVEKGRATADQAKQTLELLTGRTSYDGFGDLDLVIEAATENVELKQQLFADLAGATKESCILATNTSTIDIDVVGAKADIAPRLIGTHFFSPAHIMPLVEVIRTKSTSAQTLVDVLALAKAIKKTAVTVGNCPGFLVNRVFMPYGQITGFLVDRGVDPYRIDRALYAFGMPMGPSRMGDLAGIDVSNFAGKILDAAYSERSYRSALRELLVEAGRLGEKTGAGHYRYENGKAVEDPELATFVERAREKAGRPAPIVVTDEDLVRMPLFGVVNECCRALEEGIAIRPSDIDVACIMGYGFPNYRGGPMKWADTLGARLVHDSLAEWRERYGTPIFTPSAYLVDRAQSGRSLLG